MKKQDFMFSIGYQGGSAIIDAQARKKFGKFGNQELIAAGLYKPAFCSALYDNDIEEMEKVLAAYNAGMETKYQGIESLKRLFGVFSVPEGVVRTLEIK